MSAIALPLGDDLSPPGPSRISNPSGNRLPASRIAGLQQVVCVLMVRSVNDPDDIHSGARNPFPGFRRASRDGAMALRVAFGPIAVVTG